MSTTEKQVPDPPAKTNPFDLPPGDRTDPPLPEMTKGQVEAQVVLKGLNRSVEELKVVLDGAIKSLESDHFPELDAALVDVEKVKDKIEDTLKWTDRCQECRTAENEKVISKAEKLFRGILIESIQSARNMSRKRELTPTPACLQQLQPVDPEDVGTTTTTTMMVTISAEEAMKTQIVMRSNSRNSRCPNFPVMKTILMPSCNSSRLRCWTIHTFQT